MYKYIVACSGGNDSVALIQYMIENYPGEFCVLYNDTGWSYDEWPERISMLIGKCAPFGIKFHVTKSEGMEALVRRKKGWPMPASNMQFCTQELKEKPSLIFYADVDPQGDSVIVTGRRREESSNRASLALWQHSSEKHGGRDVMNPLINVNGSERDEYITRFGIDVLPHSSRECFCVCANKKDMKDIPVDSPWLDRIEAIEIDMGFTRNEKPRTMFRPYRCGGAVGIRQVVTGWGHGPRGWKAPRLPVEYQFKGEASVGASDIAYDTNSKEGVEFSRQCDAGFCEDS